MSNCDEKQIKADLRNIINSKKRNPSYSVMELAKNSIENINSYDKNCVKKQLCGPDNSLTSEFTYLDIPVFEGKYCKEEQSTPNTPTTINTPTSTDNPTNNTPTSTDNPTNNNPTSTDNPTNNTPTTINTTTTTATTTPTTNDSTTITNTPTNVARTASLPNQSFDDSIKNIKENIKFNINYYDVVRNYSEQKTRIYTDTEKKTAKTMLNKYKTELEKLIKDKNINDINKKKIKQEIDNIIFLKKKYNFGGKTKKNKRSKRSNKSKRSKTKKSRRI